MTAGSGDLLSARIAVLVESDEGISRMNQSTPDAQVIWRAAKIICLAALALIAYLFTTTHVVAQSSKMGMDMDAPLSVGHVAFENSCAAAVQPEIDEGVAALYSFWFPRARSDFKAVEHKQADCAIAYWGEAMSDYEQIEGGSLPEDEQLKAGLAAIAKGRTASRKTPREQAYLDAIAIIFDAKGIPDHDTRVQRFSAAMGAISAAYPGDQQAAVIYAMSLLMDGMPDDPDLHLARKALSILNGLFRTEPDNPGVIHFIIHAADNPHMADLGLEAARRYARIAPSSPHALHMPGHIFARLGLWDEDIASNLASANAADQPDLVHSQAQNLLHALEFLQYAYLQTGRPDLAAEMAHKAALIRREDFEPGFRRYYAFMEEGFPARQAIETRDWQAAIALQPLDTDVSAQGVVYWARAVGAGHRRDRMAAEQASALYRATYGPAQLAAAEAHPSSPWAETKAWTLFAQGYVAAAVALLRPVADEQEKGGKGEVELPAREMIGDMLRLSGDASGALKEYQLSLEADPGRFNTLIAAAAVAHKLGRGDLTAKYESTLDHNAPTPAGSARTELQQLSGT